MPSSTSDSEDVSVKIYFSDFFEVAPDVIETYGAFNVSLINDLPLFIDPFLLFDSEKSEYKTLHDGIIKYVMFLKQVCLLTDGENRHFQHLFLFPEVKQNWLGFCKEGNRGSGLGAGFADTLVRNLTKIFTDFGAESVTKGTHLEKMCLVEGGVGRDHLSDFITNLIKEYLLVYTEKFAKGNIDPKYLKLFSVDKVVFDYDKMRWLGKQFVLPSYGREFVLLTPKDMLTKDEAWINREDLISGFEDIYRSIPNEQLRNQVNDYFLTYLTNNMKDKERRLLKIDTINRFPGVLDYFIKIKEDKGSEAHSRSALKVRDTEVQFVEKIVALVQSHLAGTIFYKLGDSYEEALQRALFLKNVIENNDGYRLFYQHGKPIQRESDLQILYRLTWHATCFDVNREVNNGRGPVDYKISKGSKDKTVVEFKLASNSHLKRNLLKQVEIYEKANDTNKSIKVILFFSQEEEMRVHRILKEVGMAGDKNIVLIDAGWDNKPSASTA